MFSEDLHRMKLQQFYKLPYVNGTVQLLAWILITCTKSDIGLSLAYYKKGLH